MIADCPCLVLGGMAVFRVMTAQRRISREPRMVVQDVTQWIAPAMTTIAAIMTAANAGARVTGYGFVAFSIGSLAWGVYAWLTGQDSLLLQNVILLGVNMAGVWRWLGRAARYSKGVHAAQDRSPEPLIAASALFGMKAVDKYNEPAGKLIDVMIACQTGRIAYGTLSHGGVSGVGERLFAVPWRDLDVTEERVQVDTVVARLERAPAIERDKWPASASANWDRPVATR